MLPLKVKQNSGGFYFAEVHQREAEAEALSAEKHTQCENMQGHVFLGECLQKTEENSRLSMTFM